jgi:uncharacterized membrane protein YjjB (DUF3815 family)
LLFHGNEGFVKRLNITCVLNIACLLKYKFINTVKGVCVTSLLIAILSRALSFIRLASPHGVQLNIIIKVSQIFYEHVVHNTTRISAAHSTAQRTATSFTMQAMQLQFGSVLSCTVFVLAPQASKFPIKKKHSHGP